MGERPLSSSLHRLALLCWALLWTRDGVVSYGSQKPLVALAMCSQCGALGPSAAASHSSAFQAARQLAWWRFALFNTWRSGPAVLPGRFSQARNGSLSTVNLAGKQCQQSTLTIACVLDVVQVVMWSVGCASGMEAIDALHGVVHVLRSSAEHTAQRIARGSRLGEPAEPCACLSHIVCFAREVSFCLAVASQTISGLSMSLDPVTDPSHVQGVTERLLR